MRDPHFLSRPALPTPRIFKSLTAFLVLNINHIVAESSVRVGGLRTQYHGFCFLLAGHVGAPPPNLIAQSIHRPKDSGQCCFICLASIPSPLGTAPHFLLGNTTNPTTESKGGSWPVRTLSPSSTSDWFRDVPITHKRPMRDFSGTSVGSRRIDALSFLLKPLCE